jgi:alpha-galactosidase
MDVAKKMVALYKEIRATVQQGSLYRLFSPRDGSLTANQYLSEDGKQAVLFAFLHSQQFRRPSPTIYLRGLDERKLYRIRTIDDKLVEKQATASGAFLMHRGLNFRLGGDFDSTAIVLERTP